MQLTLYVAKPESVRFIGASPPSWMCALLLEDKGLPHTRVELDFAAGEHRSAEMLELNPRGTIPVLVERLDDGDVAVHETFAILEYIEWRAPGHLPAAPRSRAAASTRFHESSELKAAGMRALAYLMRTSEDLRDAEILRRDGELLATELDRWEGYLANEATWLAGEGPSLADFAVFAYVATLHQLGLELTRWPALAEHHARLAERPSVRATWPSAWGDRAARCPWPI
jgi:glutathione S-transferase